ncbi:MAG TPA: hypothetical protein VM536_03755, partial [Chloroflexia bacterium]|nr:hypothetical protein [Chloroflexia bacterium]
ARPVPDPYRLPDSPFARFTQPYTTTDVLAQDEAAATRTLLHLADFRYLAVYHMHRDYRVGDSPWEWPFGTPVYDDAEVTVYPVPPGPDDTPYVYLGNSWSLPERTPGGARRWIDPAGGYVRLWTPGGTGRLRLDFEAAPAAGPRQLAVALESQPLGDLALAPGTTREFLTPPLALSPGWYRFHITDTAPAAARTVALTRAAWDSAP